MTPLLLGAVRIPAFPLLLIGFALLAGGVGILQFFLGRKRKRELMALAQGRGWTFIERDSEDRPIRYAGFTPFGQGTERLARNIVTGSFEGMPFDLFSYRYVTVTHDAKGQQQRQAHNFRICAVPMPIAAPNLSISREGVLKKLWDAVGGSDIDFESDEFSRKFWVKCDDRKFAYDAITPQMMEHLLAHPSPFTWMWKGTTLLLRDSGNLAAEVCVPTLEMVKGFRDRLPRMLTTEPLKGQMPSAVL